MDAAGERFERLPAHAPRGEKFAKKTVDQAVQDIYNDAQVDVLHRLAVLLAETRRVTGRGAGQPGGTGT